MIALAAVDRRDVLFDDIQLVDQTFLLHILCPLCLSSFPSVFLNEKMISLHRANVKAPGASPSALTLR
jgi:hypothetical protein